MYYQKGVEKTLQLRKRGFKVIWGSPDDPYCIDEDGHLAFYLDGKKMEVYDEL